MHTKEYFEKKQRFLGIQACTLLLPKEQSMMLSYLIDTEGWDSVKRLPDDEDYFWANKEGFISNYFLGWSVKEISSAINKLKVGGYVKTKVVNIEMRKRTYIKLNFNNIVRLDNLYEEIDRVKQNLSAELTKGMFENIKKVCLQTANIDALEHTIQSIIHTYIPYLYIHTDMHTNNAKSDDFANFNNIAQDNNNLKDVLKEHFPNFTNQSNINLVLNKLNNYDFETACKMINNSDTVNELFNILLV